MQNNKRRSPRKVASLLSLTLAVLLCAFSFVSPIESFEYRETLTDGGLIQSAAAIDDTLTVLPGGMTFGVKLSTEGVVVVGFSKLSAASPSPAEQAGIKRGDILLSCGTHAITSSAGFASLIEGTHGEALTLTVKRGEKTMTKILTPQKDASGLYRAGLRVKDGTAGIGTVTAVLSDGERFVGLGHGICDGDTGILMPLKEGKIFDVSVSTIEKGTEGSPGEIKGFFAENTCGELLRNTPYGISGKFDGKCFDDIKPVKLAKRSEVTLGKASVICTLDDNVRCEYEVMLTKLTSPNGKDKNFVIEVTDEALLTKTGGIVQGMSGSPILQNGKLIGAVTHVMVNEPTRGYGIFIDSMLEAAS